jgi:cytochrome P450
VTATRISVTAILRSLLSESGLADPYAIYERLREDRSSTLAARVLVDHGPVREALTDRRFSADRIGTLTARLSPEAADETALVSSTLRSIIAFRDPPGHTRLRRLMTLALGARAVGGRRDLIRRLTQGYLDRIRGEGTTDLVRSLTFPLPAQVIAAILGIPEADRSRFERWANDVVFYVGSGSVDDALARRTLASMEQMHHYMSTLIAERRQQPRDDLLTAMLQAEDDGRLTDEEVRANALFLMTAGHETATNMLSNALLTLLRHRDELESLRHDPTRIDAVVEEVLRFESPVQMTSRIAMEDLEIEGVVVPEGASLMLLLGAANRDPSVFDEPHRFDPGRAELGHVAFGHGPHWCIGGSLAREEARVVIPMVLEQLPDLLLEAEDVRWQPTLNFRGPQGLPVRWST